MKSIHTFNQYHLGDQLVHLHFLRALAKAHPEIFFQHTCDAKHLAQLHPVVADLPNLSLSSDWSQLPPGALNAWRGTENHWYSHPDRNDFATYHLRWFEVIAQRMGGLRSPFTKREDLLFDYPALQKDYPRAATKTDVLVINSAPTSGQWQGYSQEGFETLIATLVDYGYHVTTTADTRGAWPCTRWHNLDVTAIGKLSQCMGLIIGCVTGPLWVTQNIWNKDTVALRVHLLDHERVEIAPNTVHTNSLALVPEILRDRGLL